jgi:hypothetical protein
MARYSPTTTRESAPELAPWPRAIVALAAVLFGALGGFIGWNAVRAHLAWRAFGVVAPIEVTLTGTEGEIERAIGVAQGDRLPLELAYREAADGPELRGRFHRFGETAWTQGSPLSSTSAKRRRPLSPGPDEQAWIAELRGRGPLRVSRIGSDLVSRVDRPDARGEVTGIGLFAVPLGAAAALLAGVAITGNPIRRRRSPVLFMYAFHALCLLPVVFLAVGLLGLAAPLAKVVDVPLAGLTAEWIALAVYGVVLVLLVPWVGIVVRLSRRPGTDPRD